MPSRLLFITLAIHSALAVTVAPPPCKPSRCPEFCPTSTGGADSESLVYIRSGSMPPQTLEPDYERGFFPALELNNDYPPILLRHDLTFKNQRVFVFRIDNPLYHVQFLPPKNSQCPGLSKTSQTSSAGKCLLAMNAGFFNRMSGDCVGNLVSHGNLVQLSGLENVNLGITKNGEYVVGYLTKDQIDNDEFQFSTLVSGMLWLVRNGTDYFCESYGIERPSSWFLDQVAPRSFVGFDKDGRFFIVLVEGDSHISTGLDIYDTAELARTLELEHAINLDGGGSASIVLNGVILNQVSDLCGTEKCEREVTSVVCVH